MSGPTDSIGAVAAAAGGARAIQLPIVRARTGIVAKIRENRMVVNFLCVTRMDVPEALVLAGGEARNPD
jgi:hypothetical protein